MKIVLFANTEWYLYNFRRSLALALRDAGHEVLLVSPPGPYSARLQALGLRWVEAPMERRSLNPLRELALLKWLHRFIKEEAVDAVHGFTIKSAVYGALVARWTARGKQRPVRISSVDGLGYVFTSRTAKALVLRPLVRGLLRMALGGKTSRLILQNPDDVSVFEKSRLIEKTRIRLIAGAGVNCTRFAPQKNSSQAEGGRLRVVLAARMLWDKGVAEYVEAARLLRGEGRAIDLLLAGEPDPGNPASVPVASLQGWASEGLVEWLGHIDDMPTLLASVHAVVLPSYREGLPTGLIEAGACGLPLVTTDMPGCREVVTDEVNGLLVPARDAQALAGAIARLQDNPALRQRLGAAARARALAEFDERIVIERTLAVYRELLPV